MSDSPLPHDVRAFLAGYIRSLRALELLILLHADTVREWTALELSNELRATPEWAADELRFFAERGLLVHSDKDAGRYRFAPADAVLQEVVATLSGSYPSRRFALIQAIFEAPSESVRNFADAFRLRREKPNG